MADYEYPAVSIIIPVYNLENYIEKSVESALNQTLTNIEVIIINDGSTDNSLQVVQRFLSDHRVKIYSKQNGGLSSARNLALDKATGEYITFLDGDDYLDLDYLEKHYFTAKMFDSDMVISGQKKVDDYGNVIKRLKYSVEKNPNTILRRLNVSGKIYRRDFIEKYHKRFAVGKIYEDNPFNLMMLAMAKNLKILDYQGYNQLIRMGSITSKKIDPAKLPYEALEESIHFVVEHKNEVERFDVFEYTTLSFLTYFIFQANKKHGYMKKNEERESDFSTVCEFISFSERIIKEYFPDYIHNPNLPLFKNRDLQLLQRLGVWGFVHLNKWHLLKPFAKVYYAF